MILELKVCSLSVRDERQMPRKADFPGFWEKAGISGKTTGLYFRKGTPWQRVKCGKYMHAGHFVLLWACGVVSLEREAAWTLGLACSRGWEQAENWPEGQGMVQVMIYKDVSMVEGKETEPS
jgi:hypothetical protein